MTKKVLTYYAHPGHRYSHANKTMRASAMSVAGITHVDLYGEYPRFEIDVEKEQARLKQHDVIVIQCPLFWYSTPALIKEWIDLTLEYGFAYGSGGDKLSGKSILFAITAAGPEDAYSEQGYQQNSLRTFLKPLEQTARLCKMRFVPPYVLFGSLRAIEDGRIPEHAAGYSKLLEALRDDRFDLDKAETLETLSSDKLHNLIRS